MRFFVLKMEIMRCLYYFFMDFGLQIVKRWKSCEDCQCFFEKTWNLRFVSDEIFAEGKFRDQMNNNVTDYKA